MTQTQPQTTRRSLSVTAILVFFGSLLGTLLGTFTSLGDIPNSIRVIQDTFNPPAEVCVAGSGTILGRDLGMGEAWAGDFEQRSIERVNVSVRPLGSIGGVQAAVDGACLQVLATSEAIGDIVLDDGRTALDAFADSNIEIECAAEIGYDIVAFVTDFNNPQSALEDRDMSRLLTGRNTINWNDIPGVRYDQPITIYARDNSGTTDYVLRSFGWERGERFLPPNANYVLCDSNTNCLNQTLSTPGSLYWVSTAWMQSTRRTDFLRVLPILTNDEDSPINPLKDDFDIEEYPDQLIRPLYMYVLRTPNTPPEVHDLSRAFFDYIRGIDGQGIVDDFFFYTYFDRPLDVPLDFPPGFDNFVNGSRQVCND